MRIDIVSLAFFIMTLFGMQSVHACSCVDSLDSMEKFLKGKTVFSGTAVDSRPVNALESPSFYRQLNVTTFANPSVLKGRNVQTISVRHDTYDASCGREFELGMEHFVVAYGFGDHGALQTDICTLSLGDKSQIEEFLQTGIDKKVVGRDLCFHYIKLAYDRENLIGKFDMKYPECAIFKKDYNELYLAKTSD